MTRDELLRTKRKQNFIFQGEKNPISHALRADKLGNMNMAYVGKKMGLPEWVYQNWTTTDKDDAQWVQYGIDLANQGR